MAGVDELSVHEPVWLWQVYMNLAANPSHLEAVNAVVVGKARAKQYLIGSQEQPGHGRVLPILLHGDAAFSGQGIVAEVLRVCVCVSVCV